MTHVLGPFNKKTYWKAFFVQYGLLWLDPTNLFTIPVFATSRFWCSFDNELHIVNTSHLERQHVKAFMDFFRDRLCWFVLNYFPDGEMQVTLSMFLLEEKHVDLPRLQMVSNHFSAMSSTPSWLLLQAGEVGAATTKVPRNLCTAEVKSGVLSQQEWNSKLLLQS